jgi:hypothetical protein
MHLPDQIRVAQRLTTKLRRQLDGELAEISHGAANVNVGRLVHEDREESLRRTGILYSLHSKEDVLRSIIVVAAVLGPGGRSVGCVGRVFEEEDDTVEGLEGEELGRVEGQEFFELDIFDAEVLNQRGEDALTDRQY